MTHLDSAFKLHASPNSENALNYALIDYVGIAAEYGKRHAELVIAKLKKNTDELTARRLDS